MPRLKLLIVIGISLFCVTQVNAEGEQPYVTPTECPIEVPAEADIECGLLNVPENYSLPEGRWIWMPYMILHSGTADANQTPLVFTEGGPGGNSLPSVWGFYQSGILEDRDIIIFQQRGNLFAQPELSCDFEEFYNQATESSPCLEKFKTAGVDLTQYHTRVIAQDIESLRLALGYEQWNLFTSSYSTRLGQVLMVDYPEGIRSIILQSVSPLHETRFQHDPEHSFRALHYMFEQCAADEACAIAYPDLEKQFFSLVREYNENPVELTLRNPADGATAPFTVTGADLFEWTVGSAMYDPAYPPYPTAYLPLMIDQLSANGRDVLHEFAQFQLNSQRFGTDFIAYGLYLAVNCQDDASSVTRDMIQTQVDDFPQMDGYSRFRQEWELCQLWGLPPTNPLAEEPISSEIPTLVLAGSFDPVTPPEWSRTVAEYLENAYYIEFPSKGHSIDKGTDCGMQIKRSFLQDPWSMPDTSCVADDPPPTFVLPDELVPIKGFARSVDDINFGVPEKGNPGIEVFAGISLGIFIAEILVFLVISGVVVSKWSERKIKIQALEYLPHISAVLTAAISIGSVFLLSEINQQHVWANGFVSSLGFFQSSPVVTGLGVTVLVQMLTVAMLIRLLIRAWKIRRSHLINRIFLTLVALSGISFGVFYIRWDLLKLVFI
ncbi:MAG: alpha/beta hydrolase [Anaerolineales bacterium]|nr:alpha/beta hydrolase [Anaerolineales bacterium]